jgi:hypothetical protein
VGSAKDLNPDNLMELRRTAIRNRVEGHTLCPKMPC